MVAQDAQVTSRSFGRRRPGFLATPHSSFAHRKQRTGNFLTESNSNPKARFGFFPGGAPRNTGKFSLGFVRFVPVSVFDVQSRNLRDLRVGGIQNGLSSIRSGS